MLCTAVMRHVMACHAVLLNKTLASASRPAVLPLVHAASLWPCGPILPLMPLFPAPLLCWQVVLALSPLDRWLAQHAEQLEAEEEDRGLRAEALHMLTALVDAAARGEDTRLLQQVLARMAKIGLMPTMGSITSLLQVRRWLGEGALGLGWAIGVGAG